MHVHFLSHLVVPVLLGHGVTVKNLEGLMCRRKASILKLVDSIRWV
jgi:hypothetical protein